MATHQQLQRERGGELRGMRGLSIMRAWGGSPLKVCISCLLSILAAALPLYPYEDVASRGVDLLLDWHLSPVCAVWRAEQAA